jgi:hypothetical protein
MSHFCGVGWMQLICCFWDHSRCPHCQQDNETTAHIMLCNRHGANQEWINHITNLSVWLIEVDTLPSIQWWITESLMEGLPMSDFFHLSFQSHLSHSSIGTRQDRMAELCRRQDIKALGSATIGYYHELHSK